MARALPDADLGVLFHRNITLPPDIAPRIRRVSFLNGAAFQHVPYRALLPLLPRAAESLDASGYDRVVSSSSGWAHGVHAPGRYHYCYMHTPPRYLWSDSEMPSTGRWAGQALIRVGGAKLRNWDQSAASRVTTFAANSRHISERVEAVYGRPAEVIHPPVDVQRIPFRPHSDRDFVLTVAEMVPYKRIDLAIEAAGRAKLPLVVVGDGPEKPRLMQLASGKNVLFAGRVSETKLASLFGQARIFLYPALEDFGIVTVEALAAGTPVVGLNAGGTREIVRDGMGALVHSQDPDAFAAALSGAWSRDFDRYGMRAHAESYRPERFRQQVLTWLGDAAAEDTGSYTRRVA
jgi:glycosyltransferase involved in cell wall biosynthesis